MYGKNKRINELIKQLKELSRDQDVNIWRDIAERLNKPTQNYSEVNISKLNRHTEENEEILVPGKVLGAGRLNKKITVASLSFSKQAKQKINENGGEAITIEELMKRKPSGSEIKIIR